MGLSALFPVKFVREFRDRLLVLILGIGVAFALLYAAEQSVMYLKKIGPYLGQKDLHIDDDWLGFKLNPNVKDIIPDLKNGGEIIQTIDKFGRRTTVQPPGDDYDSFVIFAPDSMLYGVNVNDDETVASRFAQITAGRKIRAYNYSVSGYGPNHFLALMTDPRFPQGIPEKRGFVVYSFIDIPIERAAYRPFFYKASPDTRMPRYILGEGGRVRRDGMATAKEAVHDTTHSVSALPGLYSDSNLLLAARILAQANVEFQKRFVSMGFFIVFVNETQSAQKMTELLEPLGIRCLDYQFLGGGHCENEPCLQPENGHPSASGNYAIAAMLVQDLIRLGVLPQ